MPNYTAILVEGMEQSAMRAGSWQKTAAFASWLRRAKEVGGHPSSPYGLRRDKEVIRLRPTGYAATRRSEIRGQRAVSLSVISYSLFVRSVVMNCLDDLKDFYDLPLTAYQELPADTTGETALNVLLFPPQQQSH